MSGGVVVVGGGLAGIAAALALAESGVGPVTLLERQAAVGGLAGGFVQGGHSYPLGYHHILDRDSTLRFFLARLGLLDRVVWRSIQMLFEVEEGLFELGRLLDFLRFPMGLLDKARFVRLMVRSARTRDWSAWLDESAATLVDRFAGPGVRRRMFEPLTRIKFGLSCAEVSGAWLGARLNHREGAAPLGYLPGTNWTHALCDGLRGWLARAGVTVRTGVEVARLRRGAHGLAAAVAVDGEEFAAARFVCALPTVDWMALAPDEATPEYATIRYTALVSLLAGCRADGLRDFYWLNCLVPGSAASGLFRLESLNPTLGAPGEACLNFVAHLEDRARPLFRADDDELVGRFGADFRRLFDRPLEPRWVRVNRIATYSPIFRRGYRNPPVRSSTFRNVWFAGNHRTYPSIASTGTALRSGLDAAAAMAGESGGSVALARDEADYSLVARAG